LEPLRLCWFYSGILFKSLQLFKSSNGTDATDSPYLATLLVHRCCFLFQVMNISTCKTSPPAPLVVIIIILFSKNSSNKSKGHARFIVLPSIELRVAACPEHSQRIAHLYFANSTRLSPQKTVCKNVVIIHTNKKAGLLRPYKLIDYRIYLNLFLPYLLLLFRPSFLPPPLPLPPPPRC